MKALIVEIDRIAKIMEADLFQTDKCHSSSKLDECRSLGDTIALLHYLFAKGLVE
jgi:hypothetical protein